MELVTSSDCLVLMQKLYEFQQQQIILWEIITIIMLLLVIVQSFRYVSCYKSHYQLFKGNIFQELKKIFQEPNYSYIENHQNLVQFVKEKPQELLQVYNYNFCFLLTYGPTYIDTHLLTYSRFRLWSEELFIL